MTTVLTADPPFDPVRAGHISSVGDAQMRITFDFAGAREVHYLRVAPEVGDFITHTRDVWVVRKVGEDGVGPLITCELPQPTSDGSIA